MLRLNCCLCVAILGLACQFHSSSAEEPATAAAPAATQLNLSPRAIEQPLLKYRLFPTEDELVDGNAAPILLRLPWEQTSYFSHIVPKFNAQLELSIDDPKLVADGPLLTDGLYAEIRRASRRRSANWEYPIHEGPFFQTLLPDAQGMRQILGRGLSAKIRYHIAIGELAKAREGINVGLGATDRFLDTPFLVVQLVGAAIDQVLLDRVVELVAALNSENMYWALTTLPRPLVDLRPSVELELAKLSDLLGECGDVDHARTEEEWLAFESRLFAVYAENIGEKWLSGSQLNAIRGQMLEVARRELPAKLEINNESVAAMCDAEALVRWFLDEHLAISHEIATAIALEPTQASSKLVALERHFRLVGDKEADFSDFFFLLGSPYSAYLGVQRIERQIDALRVVEALRHHAATHDGQFPVSLDEITEIPVPVDPITGLPFGYRLDDDSALLSAVGIRVSEIEAPVAEIRYRLTIRPE